MAIQRTQNSNVMRQCHEMGLAMQAVKFLPAEARGGYLQHHCANLNLSSHAPQPPPANRSGSGTKQLHLCWENMRQEQFREPRGSKRPRSDGEGLGSPMWISPLNH